MQPAFLNGRKEPNLVHSRVASPVVARDMLVIAIPFEGVPEQTLRYVDVPDGVRAFVDGKAEVAGVMESGLQKLFWRGINKHAMHRKNQIRETMLEQNEKR